MNIVSYLETHRALANVALEGALDRFGPHLGAGLKSAVCAGVLTGGKRLRPILCVAAHDATAGEPRLEPHLLHQIAASLEMIHAYSLMHDDLPCMDDAPLRRGEPTPHTRFGSEATARAGAALIPMAAAQVLEGCHAAEIGEERSRRIVQVLMDGAGFQGMVGGQALDLLGEGRSLQETELNRLHAWKTGALLTASLRMGGLIARAPGQQLEALTAFGRQMGLAFQIADDVLDATASAGELGKEPSDADLGKSTYVSLFGLDGARQKGEQARDAALLSLGAAEIDSPTLKALARYILERRS